MTQTQAQPMAMVESKPGVRASRELALEESLDWRAWLESFRAEHGRSPRILHIGNVANNGYNNAKVLADAGFDCDALCYDYYHIMGCPEWEDADFSGMVSDHFLPDWNEVELGGFERPRWFAQGPRLWATAYLIARQDRRRRCTKFLWVMLSVQRWLVAHRDRWWYQAIKQRVRKAQRVFSKWRAGRAVKAATAGRMTTRIRPPRGRSLAKSLAGWMRSLILDARAAEAHLRTRTGEWLWPMPQLARIAIYLVKLPILLVGFFVLLACLPLALVYHASRWVYRTAPRPSIPNLKSHFDNLRNRVFKRLTGVDLSALDTPEFESAFQKRAKDLIVDFSRRFPDRPDQLTLFDLLPYRSILPLWTELLQRYDLVEAYATDPILPMLCGYEPCVAYEHGTIREIPFDDSPTARLCALAYARANAVVITNPDCRDAAERLGVERFVPIPHLIDRKYYNPMIADAGELPPEIRPPYIFSPARHDWDVKGTDILLGAFARVSAEFPDLQLVTPSWGGDLDRSRALIERLGITNRVAMIEPVNIHNLIRVTRGARALVDQFRFGVFGGIGPTALAVGTPLITHLDHSKSDWWMEAPPYFEAWDEDSCTDALRRALTADAGALRASLRAWMRRNYWHGQVVDRHAVLFAELIEQQNLEKK
jgi:glycosyltransferase involved in cell wall biosynthesis